MRKDVKDIIIIIFLSKWNCINYKNIMNNKLYYLLCVDKRLLNYKKGKNIFSLKLMSRIFLKMLYDKSIRV